MNGGVGFLRVDSYLILRETPCGYWIEISWLKDKWVSKTGRKRYAYPTKAEALDSFIIRKERQIQITTGQLGVAKYALQIAIDMRDEGTK